MSKGQGQKIVVKFTDKLLGDVSARNPIPKLFGDYFTPIGAISGSSQSSATYAYVKAFDKDLNTYWYTTTSGNQWLQVMLPQAMWIFGFRWYHTMSNAPQGFIFQGSANGSTWDTLYTGNSGNLVGWQNFSLEEAVQYKYYRWTITSRYSSYIQINEIELLAAVGNEFAFSITGQQYQYVKGPLYVAKYNIISIELHPDYPAENCLLMIVHPQERFNNVEGKIRIQYDKLKGNLLGRGGAVESFDVDFMPDNLETLPNPSDIETLLVQPILGLSLIKINHKSLTVEETLNIGINMGAVLIKVSDINP